MGQIFRIFIVDLRRRLKRPLSIIITMCIPLAMTVIIGSVFGRSGDVELPRITMLLVDNDDALLSMFLRQGMGQGTLGEMIEVVNVDQAEGERLMARGEASAMVVIPDSFTVRVLDGEQVALRVVKNPSESFLPLIIEEVASTFAVIMDGGMKAFGESMRRGRDLFLADGWPSLGDLQPFLDEGKVAYYLAGPYVADSLITLEESTAAAADEDDTRRSGFNVFSYVMAGSLMIGLLFTSNIMLRDIVREKESGTMARILSSPTVTSQVVGGKLLAAYIVTILACLLLLLVGRFVFAMELGGAGVLAVHIIATMLMTTGTMTFCFGIMKNERAADAVVSVLIIVMALLGGSMLPVENMGASMRQLARISPVYWANMGFREIFIEGAGIADIALNIAVLCGVGLVTLVPGVYLLGRGIRKGGS